MKTLEPVGILPIRRISLVISNTERKVTGLLLVGMFGVILANVTYRSIGMPLIWADELAIYLMVWTAFIGASAGLAERDHIAITLFSDRLGKKGQAALVRAVNLTLLTMLLLLLVVQWKWFDPIAFYTAENPQTYALSTFNFMHQEPTTTLGVRKVWAWLILPIFNLSALVHVLSHLFTEGDL